ncbi:MAG: 50S ribosomal protein L12 [Nanoarchaeota archaeon]|nr:50S ribosomal protein L12 [Nanoarchaeota archaeon]MBU1501178.1 50S ribosomal protein L12 [Nanoarchaeota archaeon]
MENIYAALLLHKLGKEVNEENLKKVVTAAGAEFSSEEEVKVKSLVASLKGVDIEKELENASLVSAAPAASPSAVEKKAEPEEKKEAAAEGLSALFG